VARGVFVFYFSKEKAHPARGMGFFKTKKLTYDGPLEAGRTPVLPVEIVKIAPI
jgi:hypothetical protein